MTTGKSSFEVSGAFACARERALGGVGDGWEERVKHSAARSDNRRADKMRLLGTTTKR